MGLRTLFLGGMLVVALALTGISDDVRAQSINEGGIIEEIRIEGTQRVDPASVQSYMQVEPGDEFDPLTLDQSLKNLYDSGLFEDVTLRREGSALIVTVEENPMINRLAFEGNQRIDDEELQREVQLRPRVVYTRTKVQNDVERIQDIYRSQGRFAATVEPKIIELDQNRVDLVYEIDEGPLTGVESINFVGNEAFSGSTLRGEISTRESAWYRFMSSSDVYDPDRLAFDRELLRRFYLEEGYADFQVLSTNAELNPDRTGFIITFTVEEGPRFEFGEVTIESNLRDLEPESVEDLIDAQQGDWYDATTVEEDVQELTDRIGEQGYAFVDVQPRADTDRENQVVNIVYEIGEGPRVFVERIDIEGNVRTVDEVIRREFRLAEGDAFNQARVRRSRQRIEDLGFFRTVEMDTEEGSSEDRVIIKTEVEEQSTGELTFGAGFSTAVGPLGSVQLRERNLLGHGQDLRASVSVGGTGSEFNLGFTEPYFMDRPISAGFDIFRITRDRNEFSFKEERRGGSLRAGYDLTEHTRQVWRYTLERREIDSVDDDAPIQAKREEGASWRSSISQSLIWDRRNNKRNPTEGFITDLTTQFTGLGGNVRFVRASAGGKYYFPLGDEWTVSLGARGGTMHGLGQDTRISDRFQLGADEFRGFDYGGIGPRDDGSGDPLGGNHFAKGTVEFIFPLGLPDEFDVRGRLFSDFGTVWGVDDDTDVIGDNRSIRVSVGPGVSWDSPLGLINIDLGFPIQKESYDETQIFNFSFGTQF
ncbi:outer membrane protein assembly factor BamA [Fodinicurvata halophila]|uniref:Outer membrane protein assembly factor BamA n=1 Tax=Fodinicurvata halophila TaxID=1419723 RepID=A0ABV8UL93_9PROT